MREPARQRLEAEFFGPRLMSDQWMSHQWTLRYLGKLLILEQTLATSLVVELLLVCWFGEQAKFVYCCSLAYSGISDPWQAAGLHLVVKQRVAHHVCAEDVLRLTTTQRTNASSAELQRHPFLLSQSSNWLPTHEWKIYHQLVLQMRVQQWITK